MSLFVCSVHETLDIYAPLQNELEDNWMSLLPALVFLQSAYGEACWHVKLRNACLIIDDPTLEKSYGFVEYRELADRAHADDFSVNIAFIPYNRKRNHQEVVDRFHAEPERFSVSIHGCYHTEREFGTANIAEARFLSYTAQQLMRDHGEMTGLRANNVMVFPQEVWSECALYSLKEAGYLAACASRVYPQEKFEKSQAANLIDLADIHRHQFPLFVRKYFSDVSLELLTILHLVGRPIVLVCHHDDFRNGYSRLSQIVRDIRMISPSIVWSSLESVARNAVRYHRTGAGDFRAQIFSRSAYVRNELSRAVSYKIFKKENELDRVLAVRVDGRVVDHQLSEECGVSISQVLEPNSIIEIEVEYQFNQEYLFRRGLKRKMLTHLRRVLCYYRDTLIAPAKKKMGLK